VEQHEASTTRTTLPTRDKYGRLVDPREIPVINPESVAITHRLAPLQGQERENTMNDSSNTPQVTMFDGMNNNATGNAGKENSIQQVNDSGKRNAAKGGTAAQNKGISHNKKLAAHNQNVSKKP
jgi:hypothetical protein